MRAVAANPFEERWWLGTDSPFQLLAACLDLSDALELDDPTSHVSHIAVHQDGSCNGLQHYAALARDVRGAEQVNLLPSDKPQDVYIGVAHLLQDKVNEDLESDDDETRELAELCVDRITRKLVKQTVMTSVYGVTFIGARDQIHRRLEEQENDLPLFEKTPPEKIWNMSVYLARHTMACVGDSFRGMSLVAFCATPFWSLRMLLVAGARQTMDYLAKCASVIGSAGEQVKWVTPLNLPIMQPYKRNPAVRRPGPPFLRNVVTSEAVNGAFSQRKAVQTVLQSVVIATNNDHQPFHKARQVRSPTC